MAKTISDKIHGIGTDIFQDLDVLEKDTQGWSSTG